MTIFTVYAMASSLHSQERLKDSFLSHALTVYLWLLKFSDSALFGENLRVSLFKKLLGSSLLWYCFKYCSM